jgi:Interferon-related developmental regulator (IFRD)
LKYSCLFLFSGRGDHHSDNSDDELSGDNASMYSTQSEYGDSQVGEEMDENGLTGQEKNEEKFMQALESVSEKSAQTRTNGLQQLCDLMMHHYMPDFVDDRKMTLMDVIEKSVKRGKGGEQAFAANLASLLIMQLNGDEDVTKVLSPVLLVQAQNDAVGPETRAKCCLALGLLNFLSGEHVGDLLTLMRHMEKIFSGSYVKGDNSPSSANAPAAQLHAAALSAWGLLLTQIPSGDFVSLMEQDKLPSIKHLMGLLRSPHLDVRMAAGETIALILELGREHDEDFLEDHLPDLVDATKQLATDSQKFRAKRDRRQQRATFRDVLRYVEEDISPEIRIKYGKESTTLDTWAIHHQYTSLCTAMGNGINTHLIENDFVRDVLGLGEKIDENCKTGKSTLSKAQKVSDNA